MHHSFSRLELGIGIEKLNRLKKSTVMIFGIGGVGSYTAEALARSAVGRLILIDKDIIDITNINRQIHSLTSTVGRVKVEVMKERIHDINPQCEVIPIHMYYDENTAEQIFDYQPDYIVDAIDSINSKIHLILESKKRNIPIISSMGAGNKLDPALFQVTDISKTYMDPVAKAVRQKLKKMGITKGVKVVFSPEKPLIPEKDPDQDRTPPSSNAFVPSVAGLIMASVVVRALIGEK